MTYLKKTMTSVLGVVIITCAFYVYFTPPPVQEGLDVNSLLKTGFDDAFKPVQSYFTDEFAGPLSEITGFVAEAEPFLAKIPALMQDIKHFLVTAGAGIEQEFVNLGVSIKTGFDDIFSLISLFKNVFIYLNELFSTYLVSRINCGLEKMGNIRYCFLFYVMDLVGYTLWGIFIQFPVWIISLFGLNLQSGIDHLVGYIDAFDTMVHSATGYHLVHYSDHTTELCYSCQNLQDMPVFPTQQFQDQLDKINTDLNTTVPGLMSEASTTIMSAETQLLALI